MLSCVERTVVIMKYPCLVDKRLCKTPIHVEFEQDSVTNRGEPLPPVIYDGTCNYQDTAKTVRTSEKKLIETTGAALFPGDIAHGLPVISGGTVIVFGVERRIASGTKARNPDGTVNYTRLELV